TSLRIPLGRKGAPAARDRRKIPTSRLQCGGKNTRPAHISSPCILKESKGIAATDRTRPRSVLRLKLAGGRLRRLPFRLRRLKTKRFPHRRDANGDVAYGHPCSCERVCEKN